MGLTRSCKLLHYGIKFGDLKLDSQALGCQVATFTMTCSALASVSNVPPN